MVAEALQVTSHYKTSALLATKPEQGVPRQATFQDTLRFLPAESQKTLENFADHLHNRKPLHTHQQRQNELAKIQQAVNDLAAGEHFHLADSSVRLGYDLHVDDVKAMGDLYSPPAAEYEQLRAEHDEVFSQQMLDESTRTVKASTGDANATVYPMDRGTTAGYGEIYGVKGLRESNVLYEWGSSGYAGTSFSSDATRAVLDSGQMQFARVALEKSGTNALIVIGSSGSSKLPDDPDAVEKLKSKSPFHKQHIEEKGIDVSTKWSGEKSGVALANMSKVFREAYGRDGFHMIAFLPGDSIDEKIKALGDDWLVNPKPVIVVMQTLDAIGEGGYMKRTDVDPATDRGLLAFKDRQVTDFYNDGSFGQVQGVVGTLDLDRIRVANDSVHLGNNKHCGYQLNNAFMEKFGELYPTIKKFQPSAEGHTVEHVADYMVLFDKYDVSSTRKANSSRWGTGVDHEIRAEGKAPLTHEAAVELVKATLKDCDEKINSKISGEGEVAGLPITVTEYYPHDDASRVKFPEGDIRHVMNNSAPEWRVAPMMNFQPQFASRPRGAVIQASVEMAKLLPQGAKVGNISADSKIPDIARILPIGIGREEATGKPDDYFLEMARYTAHATQFRLEHGEEFNVRYAPPTGSPSEIEAQHKKNLAELETRLKAYKAERDARAEAEAKQS